MSNNGGVSVFERFLSLWVALCVATGIGLGVLFFHTLSVDLIDPDNANQYIAGL